MTLERCIVSRRIFTFIWIGVAVSYFVCGTILAAHGLLYFYVLLRAKNVIFSVELLGVSVHPQQYPYIGAASLVIALIHLIHFVTMLSRSTKTRSLQFPIRFAPRAHKSVRRVTLFLSPGLNTAMPSRSSYIGCIVRSLGDCVISLWKAFDVTSTNYGVMYILREFIQTGIQTQQAYELSAHVDKSWMNHSIVFLLVLNCWAMPLIHYGLGIKSTATNRLLCLLVNLMLDFVSYFAFPIALVMPYTKDFNATTGSFDKIFWYRDVWFIQLMNGWPLVFATSVWDGFSRLLITFSMTRTLRAIAKLLQQPIRSSSKIPTARMVSDVTHSLASVVPTSPRSISTSSFTRRLGRLPPSSVVRTRAEKWGHRLLAVWGSVVLALHLQASSTPTNPRCLLQVRPWLVRRPVCSLMELNCYSGQITGNASDFDATLDSIDTQWLSYLIIRHCNAVVVTPRIQELSWLMGIKIHNSTLLQWDSEAALTQTHHPHMVFAFVISTNVTSFPRALYHLDFPIKLRDIEFSDVNLTQIPSEVANVWHPGTFLVMERLQLSVFPDVLAKLQPSYFSVACNNFTEIPTPVFENPELFVLVLNGNPISELPSGRFHVPALHIKRTQITKIPPWMDAIGPGYEFMAGSTPLCDAIDQRNVTALALSSSKDLETWRRRVDCTPVDGFQYLTLFPLEDEPTNNPSKII